MLERTRDAEGVHDVIIVGAGPAGCVLARRLSEHADKRVLLLEAGGDWVRPGAEHPDIVDPFALSASSNPQFHWPNIRASVTGDSGGHEIEFLQARGVGGASNINGMGVDRGLPSDFEEWGALGAHSWAWTDVLPYFRKLERDLDFADRHEWHGSEGPMPVRRPVRRAWAPFASAIGEAFETRGFRYLEDYLAEFGEGYASTPTNGVPRRVSAAMAYLDARVRARCNLTIRGNAHVDRVRFDGMRAVGVDLSEAGRSETLYGRLIVLCGGAVQTPALLMRSGIGPGAHLAELGIDVIVDNAGVGDNLRNHASVALTAYLGRAAARQTGQGSFLQNWCRFRSDVSGTGAPDMHLMVLNRSAWHALGRRLGALVVTLMKPLSKGSVALTSPLPAKSPRIKFNFLSDPFDLERMVAGVRRAADVLGDNGVRANVSDLVLPDHALAARLRPRSTLNASGASILASILDRAPLRRLLLTMTGRALKPVLEDEPRLRAFVRETVQPQFHVCGTARMGPANAGGVVDDGGRVHGVSGLRIADASIFPNIPAGYIHFIVIMAAEKISDAIKTDW